MAVELQSTIQRWSGLSTDSKPTATINGSLFYEINTGATYRWSGTAWKKVVDISIDYGHWEIHDGDSFTAYYTRTTAATDQHRSGVYILTGAKEVHLVVSFAASAAATYEICEAPTIAATTGTAGNTIYNRKRDSSNTSTCYDNASPAVANKFTTLTEVQLSGDGTWAKGTVLRAEPIVSGTGPKPAGGASRDSQEYILKVSTKYVFLLTNNGANANTHYILLDWYERSI